VSVNFPARSDIFRKRLVKAQWVIAMNKISVILTSMFALAGSVAVATSPNATSSGGGGYSGGGGGGSSGGGGSGAHGGGGGSSSGGGGGGAHGGGGGSSSGGGGGGHSGGGGSGGGGGGHGYGGQSHSSAAAAGWTHGGAANGNRGIPSGANGTPYRAVELRSHAAARATIVADHTPHPPRPNGPRPNRPLRPYQHVIYSVRCAGNIDCALWSNPDPYCTDNLSEYRPIANGDIGDYNERCPHPQRLEINQRSGIPAR
jgi:hypothetical protein